ncbi:MAG: RNA polymerase Rpb4 family protein [Thermoplasmatota archaeon]
MSVEEKKEELLTHDEVRKVLEDSMDKPSVIYTGPEDDGFRSNIPAIEEIEGSEEEADPFSSLSFEKRSTLEHVTGFLRIKQQNAKKMIKELVKLERISDGHAFKIAEIMPRDEHELRPIFAKDRFTLSPEELKQILDIINKHRD